MTYKIRVQKGIHAGTISLWYVVSSARGKQGQPNLRYGVDGIANSHAHDYALCLDAMVYKLVFDALI